MADFCHLHNHSQYSMLDGATRIEDLMRLALLDGQPAVALTDHGNMFGALEFYMAPAKVHQELLEEAEERGDRQLYDRLEKQGPVKPIIGMEAYIVPDGKTLSDRVRVDGDYGYHLVLLAENETGYRNLMQLSTLAYLEGHYYRPRIDKEALARHASGLLMTSTDIGGEIAQAVLKRGYEEARRLCGAYLEIIGRENFYFEIQDHSMGAALHDPQEYAELSSHERNLNQAVLRLAREFDRPVIATNDVHYARREDARAHDVLLCIGTGRKRADPDRLRFPCDQFYFKTEAEMAVIFADSCPAAVTNSREIAERVRLELDLAGRKNRYHLPRFPVPPGVTATEYFRKLVHQGLRRRYGQVPPAARERAEYELDVIGQMDLADYLLIVWDIVRAAREKGIPVGPGRGSAAGSLCCYATGITDLDPLKYDLLFERFINPGRIEMPDIDLDFCQARRQEIVEYVIAKYGRDKVSHIITFATMAARAAIRDVGRVLDVPLPAVDRIAKLVPSGPKVTLRETLKSEPDFRHLYQTDETAHEVVDIATTIEGLARQPGTHAAGIVIADQSLVEYCPLYTARNIDTSDEGNAAKTAPADKKRREEETVIATQYHMKLIDPLGLLKIDLLGLQTLTVIDLACRIIKERHGLALTMDCLPTAPLAEGESCLEIQGFDNAKLAAAYALLARGESKGIFQFEREGMRQMLLQARPDRMEDLIALNAMYRPGPLENIPTFIRRKHGREPIRYLHPALKPFLENTYGVICYQEQVMRIAQGCAGFSLSEADILRKAMGKKIRHLMEEYRPRFVEGMQKTTGCSAAVAEKIWDAVEKFSGYGFNKSHSAAYAFIALQTAYLKANYPAEFMAALLTLDAGNTNKVVEYLEEAARMGLKVSPPDVNTSRVDFTVTADDEIRFGLSAVKGVGTKAVEAIVAAREKNGAFGDLYRFCERVDGQACAKPALEALIKAGAFDSLGARRAQLAAVLEEAVTVGQKRQRDEKSGQENLFAGLEDHSAPSLPDLPEWDDRLLLEYEKSVLGFYLTGHPLQRFQALIRCFATATIADLKRLPDGAEVLLGALIQGIRYTVTREGQKKMAVLTLEDFGDTIEAVLFPAAYERAREHLAKEATALFEGQVDSSRGAAQLIVNEVIPLERAREQLAGSVCVDLPEGPPVGQAAGELQEILEKHRGPAALYFCIGALLEGREYLCQAGFGVAPGAELENDLCALLGEGRIRYARKAPGGNGGRMPQFRKNNRSSRH